MPFHSHPGYRLCEAIPLRRSRLHGCGAAILHPCSVPHGCGAATLLPCSVRHGYGAATLPACFVPCGSGAAIHLQHILPVVCCRSYQSCQPFHDACFFPVFPQNQKRRGSRPHPSDSADPLYSETAQMRTGLSFSPRPLYLSCLLLYASFFFVPRKTLT